MGLFTPVNAMVLFTRPSDDHIAPGDGIQGVLYQKRDVSGKIDVKLKFIVGVDIYLVKVYLLIGFRVFNLKIKGAYSRHF